jgi:hypothetical protein
MLNLDQLKAAVAAGKQRFALLRKKYPELKGYLVLSLPTGQTAIDSAPVQVLDDFPTMVIDHNENSRPPGLMAAPNKQATSI